MVENVVTKQKLKDAFESVGLGENQIVEVHASLSSLGYVIGGAQTVVDALMETVTSQGTLIMATHTSGNTDPSGWQNPAVPAEQWDEIREAMPAYEPETGDLYKMGAVAENFRHRPHTVCSCHPVLSYTAWGRYAKLLCNRQSLHFPLAEESPAARLYEMKGSVLLIGTGFETATCMHLAEYRCECRPIIIESTCVNADGRRTWKRYLNLDIRSDEFAQVGAQLAKKSLIRQTKLNSCLIQMFPVSAAVDEAVDYFDRNTIYNLYR